MEVCSSGKADVLKEAVLGGEIHRFGMFNRISNCQSPSNQNTNVFDRFLHPVPGTISGKVHLPSIELISQRLTMAAAKAMISFSAKERPSTLQLQNPMV